jgi:hypothetical protein
MPALRSALLAATLILAATAIPAVAPATAGTAAPGSGTAGCVTTFEPPSTWIVVCSNGGGSGGGGGGGGGGGKVVCTLQPLSPGNIAFFGLPPAPPGEEWAAITCPGNSPFGGVTLVDTAGAPAVTPQELLQEVEGQLTVAPLPAQTAPPQPKDGLVGLPEWFWIPKAQWRPVRTQRLQVGPVWAQVTATPQKIMFVAGGGQGQKICDGPGTPFSAAAPNATSACSYTYQQSSATQQGGAYAASVTVVWRVTWAGFSPATGPVGGVLNAALPIADPFNLKVAEGQALVSGTGVSQ